MWKHLTRTSDYQSYYNIVLLIVLLRESTIWNTKRNVWLKGPDILDSKFELALCLYEIKACKGREGQSDSIGVCNTCLQSCLLPYKSCPN